MTGASGALLGLVAAAVLALGSCGFVTEDELALSYEAVDLEVSDRALRRELEGFLMGKGVAVTDSAPLQIEVDGRRSEEVVSLTATGTANKVGLVYRFRYRLRRGGELLRDSEFALREVITHNESRFLAKRKERRNIFRSMRERAISRIWFRIRQDIRSG